MINKVKPILQQYQDIICDCDYFGSGEEKHTDGCNYTRLMNDIDNIDKKHKLTKNKCDICLRELSKREIEILQEIEEDNEPCNCKIVKRIVLLEDCSNKIVNCFKDILPLVIMGYLKSIDKKPSEVDKNGSKTQRTD